ncbi:MAG: hypothetical protein QXH80_02455 [Candidatus Nanoarchaeia archaeon]
MIRITVKNSIKKQSLEPIFCGKMQLGDFPIVGLPLKRALELRISRNLHETKFSAIEIFDDFWPSDALLDVLRNSNKSIEIITDDGDSLLLAKFADDTNEPEKIISDRESLIICFPWDLIALNETEIKKISHDKIEGEIRNGVTIDGHIILGAGSVLLPGVYIEGNVIIGENSKIGPNCYLRGNTYIGDRCHIGQAVEIKNSILLEKVSAGHLSYIGDSIICSHTNLGAGTITANLRHDGKNQCSMVDGELVDTGRRKLGAIIGENVHTGIHTSIYPGRKIWPHASTRPGEIVFKDIPSPICE